jgi:hypothetical protein
MENVGIFPGRNILKQFGTYYGHLVILWYYIWYVIPFWYVVTRKNLATLICLTNRAQS